MISVRWLLGLAFAVAGGLMAVSASQAQQIMYDASGRQLEHPRDRATRPAVSPRATPSESKSQFGRVPFESGTMGLETEKKIRADEMPDGRPVPAIESQRKQNISPFVGFSLSVPTN